MPRPIRRAAVSTALALAIAGVSGQAQAPQGQPGPRQPAPADQAPPPESQQQPQPVFRAGVNYVRVDVIVSDKQGNAVNDLKAQDFEVTEEGRPQAIDTFKLIKLDGGVAEAAKEAPRQIRSEFDEEAEAARDDVRLFAVFLDDYHVRRGSSMAARQAIADFVATQLGPSDMIGMMYPLDSIATIRMTRNHDAIARGIRQFTGRKFDYTPRNAYEEQYFQYPTEVVEKIRNQVSMTAIRALITHMGSLKEGRKALILVSEGFTAMLPPQMRDANAAMPGAGNPNRYDPAAGGGDLNEERANWGASLDLQSELQAVYDAANKNNVAIYAVDPRGLAASEFDINENVGGMADANYLRGTTDTLRMLADNTDGRAIVNGNDIGAELKQVVRDTSAYYLLGYSSSLGVSDGKFHEIKVRVKRPGVQVRARRGYWAMTAEETARALAPPKPEVARDVSAALATVAAPTRSRVVRTWIGAERGEAGRTKMTFVWEPMPKVPGDRRIVEAPARILLLAVGADGEPYYRGRVTGPVSFDVPPGKMELSIKVEGPELEVLDSETRNIDVPDLSSGTTTLGTPAVYRARTVREFEQLKTNAAAVPVPAREFTRTDRLLFRVPVYGPGGAPPTISARLLNRSGDPMAELPVASQPGPASQAQIELLLTSLPPGDYIVEIKAAASAADARQLVAFRITG